MTRRSVILRSLIKCTLAANWKYPAPFFVMSRRCYRPALAWCRVSRVSHLRFIIRGAYQSRRRAKPRFVEGATLDIRDAASFSLAIFRRRPSLLSLGHLLPPPTPPLLLLTSVKSVEPLFFSLSRSLSLSQEIADSPRGSRRVENKLILDELTFERLRIISVALQSSRQVR